MPPFIQRFGPPAAVFGIALYLGWPPAQSLDLGDNIVKAKSVRWKQTDLAPPNKRGKIVDPFRDVLIADESMEVEPDTGKLVVATRPAGPDPLQLKNGLQLSGIASLGGKSWAIINGKPRLIGDQVFTDGNTRLRCQIIAIAADHVVVRSEETEVTIRSKPFGFQSPKPAAIPNQMETQELVTPAKPPGPSSVPPPPA